MMLGLNRNLCGGWARLPFSCPNEMRQGKKARARINNVLGAGLCGACVSSHLGYSRN